TLYVLQVVLMDYVHWWNNFRPHGALNYESPIDYRKTWEEEQSENGRDKSFVYRSATESKQYEARTERVVLPL
ncbi:IS3 family transposase, partial [Aerococcus viridans]|uniref:IS3 family transposase n=1 Tax=Aerococcus viridans TaxID=1377 RepID=UPI002DBEA5BD